LPTWGYPGHAHHSICRPQRSRAANPTGTSDPTCGWGWVASTREGAIGCHAFRRRYQPCGFAPRRPARLAGCLTARSSGSRAISAHGAPHSKLARPSNERSAAESAEGGRMAENGRHRVSYPCSELPLRRHSFRECTEVEPVRETLEAGRLMWGEGAW